MIDAQTYTQGTKEIIENDSMESWQSTILKLKCNFCLYIKMGLILFSTISS